MLLIISIASAFLIFLDYHKSRDIHKSIIHVALLFAVMFALGFALDLFRFKLLYLVIVIPPVLFGVLFLKNAKKDEVDF